MDRAQCLWDRSPVMLRKLHTNPSNFFLGRPTLMTSHFNTLSLQALIKRDMLLFSYELLYTNFCERIQFLFYIKRLSKFSVQMLWDMCLLFVKTLVVIIKSAVVSLYTLHKCIVIAWIACALQKLVRWQLMQTRLLRGLIYDNTRALIDQELCLQEGL